mmetsp:Transcript_107472/g.283372  ORF Transcript_107472/g.283372 Transcript_107472/m.283372 type:complete len:557 (+) Transcript_107472:323-1993(+)
MPNAVSAVLRQSQGCPMGGESALGLRRARSSGVAALAAVAVRALGLVLQARLGLDPLPLALLQLLPLHAVADLLLPAHLLLLLRALRGLLLLPPLAVVHVLLHLGLVEAANARGVQHDGVWLQLLKQAVHLLLPPLPLCLEGVLCQSVKVCHARARNDHAGEAGGVTDATHVLVGPEPHAAHQPARVQLRQVGLARPGQPQHVLPDLHARPEAQGHQPSGGDVDVLDGVAEGPPGVDLLVLSKVPDLPVAVGPSGDHVVAPDGQPGHVARVTEQLHNGRLHVRRPHRDTAVRVTDVHDGVGGILPHAPDGAQPRLVRTHLLAGRDVAVPEVGQLPPGHQEVVEPEEVHVSRILRVLQTVYLDPVVVVYVRVFLLRDGKECVVVKRLHCTYRFLQLQLSDDAHGLAVHHRNVPLAPCGEHMLPVGGKRAAVGPEGQVEREPLLGHAAGGLPDDVGLGQLRGVLELAVHLQGARLRRLQHLALDQAVQGLALVLLRALHPAAQLEVVLHPDLRLLARPAELQQRLAHPVPPRRGLGRPAFAPALALALAGRGLLRRSA